MLHGRDKGLLTFRQRAVFLFSELWYGLFALTYLVLYALPLVALVTNKPIVTIAFTDFVMYSTPVTAAAMVGVGWGYYKGWYRPGNHFFVSWQGVLLTAARWPIVLMAIFNALISVVFQNGAFTYMVTPKGSRALASRDSLRIAVPYIVLATIPIIITLLYPRVAAGTTHQAAGYVLFALFSTALFTCIILAIVIESFPNQYERAAQLAADDRRLTPISLGIHDALTGPRTWWCSQRVRNPHRSWIPSSK